MQLKKREKRPQYTNIGSLLSIYNFLKIISRGGDVIRQNCRSRRDNFCGSQLSLRFFKVDAVVYSL